MATTADFKNGLCIKHNNDIWKNQAIQREFLLKGTDAAKPDDYIFFSDPDEIPNPKFLNDPGGHSLEHLDQIGDVLRI